MGCQVSNQLEISCMQDHVTMVEFLLSDKRINMKGDHMWHVHNIHPFVYAALNGSSKVVQLFLKHPDFEILRARPHGNYGYRRTVWEEAIEKSLKNREFDVARLILNEVRIKPLKINIDIIIKAVS